MDKQSDTKERLECLVGMDSRSQAISRLEDEIGKMPKESQARAWQHISEFASNWAFELSGSPRPAVELKDDQFLLDKVGTRVKVWFKPEGQGLIYREFTEQELMALRPRDDQKWTLIGVIERLMGE